MQLLRRSRFRGSKTLFGFFLCCWSLLSLPGFAAAATITAASPALLDVATAVNRAATGDLVVIPPGTSTWTSTLAINKAITLQGAGIGRTVINYGVPNNWGVNINLPTAGRFRLTGVEFNGGNSFGSNMLIIHGPPTSQFEIDHCKFRNVGMRTISSYSGGQGLIDHCSFLDNWLTVSLFNSYENQQWNQPITVGTANCIVIEDCDIQYVSSPGGHATTGGICTFDGQEGMKRTVRHCTWTNNLNCDVQLFDAHGNIHAVTKNPDGTTTGDMRGTIQWECYSNTFTNNAVSKSFEFFDIRGGTCLVYNNTIKSASPAWFRVREEDGTAASVMSTFSYGSRAWSGMTTYPAYDMPKCYFGGGNIVNGAARLTAMNDISFAYRGATTSSARTLVDCVSITAGSKTVIHSGSGFSSSDVGLPIDASGIPAGTKIVSVTNSTTAVMSAAATASRSCNLSASPPVHYRVAIGTREDAFFLQQGRDIFFTQMPGYTPLSYPHPFLGPAPPTNLTVVR